MGLFRVDSSGAFFLRVSEGEGSSPQVLDKLRGIHGSERGPVAEWSKADRQPHRGGLRRQDGQDRHLGRGHVDVSERGDQGGISDCW